MWIYDVCERKINLGVDQENSFLQQLYDQTDKNPTEKPL